MAALHPFGFLGATASSRELRRLRDEMDRLMDGLAPAAGEVAMAAGFPAVNVYAGQDGIAVVAELPGIEKEDLEVQAHQDTLTLRGIRRPVRRSRTPTTAASAAAARSPAASSCPAASTRTGSRRTWRTVCCG